MTNTKNNNNQTIFLCNGCSVDPDTFDIVCMFLEERIPLLSPDNTFTLKQIVGEENWDNLSKRGKIEAGYSMVHLVEKKEVPFKTVKGRHEYPKLYQLTSTELGMRIP